jgi:predicted Ser/Thr protein kinase
MKDFKSIKITRISGNKGEKKFKVSNPTTYQLIGKGGQGVVFKLNEQQCVKIYEKQSTAEKEAYALNLGNELSFIPKVYEIGSNYIIMDYIKGKDLKTYLKENGKISKHITQQIITIAKELKRVGFKRINLPLRHLIITENDQIKVIDHVNSMNHEAPVPTDLIKGLKKLKQLDIFMKQVNQLDPEIYAKWREIC